MSEKIKIIATLISDIGPIAVAFACALVSKRCLVSDPDFAVFLSVTGMLFLIWSIVSVNNTKH